MPRINLTERFVKSRKAAPAGRRNEYLDAILPGLALRVTDSGHKSFVLIARYPRNPKNPTRRSLGGNGELTLNMARERAREWLSLIRKGVDPKIEEARQKAATRDKQANTFPVVAEAFLARGAANLAKAKEGRSIIEKEFVERWRDRLASEITPREVSEAVRAIADRGAPYQAHNAFGWLRRLYNWAITAGDQGIQVSPVAPLSATDIISHRRESRSRTLNVVELRLVWEAAAQLGYPYGPVIQMLILTGQRLREVADMTWDEVDLEEGLWTIPKARMKGDRVHEVPLSRSAQALLETLPRWTKGKHVFSSTDGATHLNGFSKAKSRIDNLIAAERVRLGSAAADSGAIAPWVFHDLRRTVRTQFSALPVQDLVRELVIAHARPGLHKVYDQHSYRDEKRECLNLWDARLQNSLENKQQRIAHSSATSIGKVAQQNA